MRDIKLYLLDIIEAMSAIERFVEGIDFEAFKNDDMRLSAVIWKFEIIGEATKNIPEGVRDLKPEIPWKEMAGLRDKLIHFYFGIKHELVWSTIKNRIPAIKPLLQDIVRKIEQEAAEREDGS